MGLMANVYRAERHRGNANGGISDEFDTVVIVNVEGPFEPGKDSPAVMLVPGNGVGIAKIVPADEVPPGVFEQRQGSMFGGSYVGTSDSRFTRAVEKLIGGPFYGAVAFHDRYESAELSRQLSSD